MKQLLSNRRNSHIPFYGSWLLLMLLITACASSTKKTETQAQTTDNTNNQSNEALVWQKYIGEIDTPDIPKLFDYSYAGYKRGEVGVPKTFDALKTFNVLDFGAIPNDTLSDQNAIQAAINAAQLNNGGIVFFPPGEFLVNVKPTESNPIEITSSNIILKGSGWGKNGTTINMVNHMLQSFPDQPEWQVNYMYKFFSKKGEGQPISITKNANEGAFSIEVEDGESFKNSKFIQLEMAPNVDAVDSALQGKLTRPHWERIIETGVTYVGYHEIERISGNTIFLKDPLTHAINATHNWVAKSFYPLENVGVEDIFFKANFTDEFVHHKDFLHDNAWSMVAMARVANSWVRRCKFANVTGGVSLGNSYASSIVMLIFEGNSGHKLTNVAQSTRILTGLINDVSSSGQFHGASMSHRTSGSVIWRVKNPKQGWDSHAEFPINNLVDLYEGSKMTNHGGFHKNEPHHLKGLTLWNYKRNGDTITNYDFWKMSGKYKNDMYWGFSVVNPNIIGLHGSLTTFNEENVGYLESLGKAVLPGSLYEAQLQYRLKKTPEWLSEILADWKEMEMAYQENDKAVH
ncbi:DUF4955 domain-containing protein [Gelidibacter salicanalis]|uniref:DUF4955 domain-containing protein n=1 Tax=Gelidibacter salicanalis TaxID=291193 RepID=A0A934NJ67_9FLAO|nr:DUF4955 domain-containing protein [Gelidibacter salicanalis]MBJ7882991.1 DUF4955 domain-containing protein [Gelidibacter salicanalis]